MTTPDAPSIPLPHPGGPLAGYRVLDLANELGQLCTRLLGELGADVIKVEPPGGDPTRHTPPFYRDEEGPESSLFWWTMNAGKRSITCELRLEQGRALLHRLAATADMLVETAVPGTQVALGIDYETLRAVNPQLVVVSISPFGQTGPYAGLLATDIVASAMGGHMYLNGDDEHGPVRTTAPQAYTQANLQGAVGAMTALYARHTIGRGQHVDVSMQEAMANAMDNAQQTWDIRKRNVRGPGVYRNRAGDIVGRYLYEASDGWVTCLANGGLSGPNGSALIDWLAEHGAAGDLANDEWRLKLATQAPLDAGEQRYVEERLMAFCKRHRKAWLVREAQARGAGWAPVLSPREIAENEQLRARDFWVQVAHDDIGESFVYAGAPWKLSKTPWKQRGRAPHVGEHNDQLYGELLGLDGAEMRRLKLRRVI